MFGSEVVSTFRHVTWSDWHPGYDRKQNKPGTSSTIIIPIMQYTDCLRNVSSPFRSVGTPPLSLHNKSREKRKYDIIKAPYPHIDLEHHPTIGQTSAGHGLHRVVIRRCGPNSGREGVMSESAFRGSSQLGYYGRTLN